MCRSSNKQSASTNQENDSTNSTIAAAYFYPTLAATSSATTPSLSKYTSKISINGHIVKALFGSGSSESFIYPNLVKQLALGINPSSCQVSMASTSLSSQVVGAVNVNIKMIDFEYSNVTLHIMKDLCVDIILG